MAKYDPNTSKIKLLAKQWHGQATAAGDLETAHIAAIAAGLARGGAHPRWGHWNQDTAQRAVRLWEEQWLANVADPSLEVE